MSQGTKFEPIKDTQLKKLTLEDRVKALGGVHMAYVDRFHHILSPLIVEGLNAAKAAGRPMSDVCFVLADRQDEFFQQCWVEVAKESGEVTAGHGVSEVPKGSYRWLVPAYFLDTAGVNGLIERLAPLGKLLSEAAESEVKAALRAIDKVVREERAEGVKAWGAMRFQMWWMYSDVLTRHPIASDPQHPHYSTWTDMGMVSEYGPKVLVILGNSASAQVIQPMPETFTPG